jgi:GntR family transcriptional regulator/MocR family aminotransferase
MHEFIREGHFARHIRRMRPIYAERREVLVRELVRVFGEGAEIVGDEAGLHVALLISKLRNDRQLAAHAAKEALWLSPLSASFVGKSPRHGLVLGFGNTRANQIPAAVRQVKTLVAKMARVN